MSPAPESREDHAYFRAIEETFIRLRGSPLLLSPADWQVAKRWHRRGVPLDLVCRALEEFFERRRERGAEGKVSSLRYCAPAVEAAWRDYRSLTAPGEAAPAPALDVGARLARLAAAVPASLAGGEHLARRIRALDGPVESVEAALGELDRELLRAAREALPAGAAEKLEAKARRRLGRLAARLPAAEQTAALERLTAQRIRDALGLPLLSLFAPEASAGDDESS